MEEETDKLLIKKYTNKEFLKILVISMKRKILLILHATIWFNVTNAERGTEHKYARQSKIINDGMRVNMEK